MTMQRNLFKWTCSREKEAVFKDEPNDSKSRGLDSQLRRIQEFKKLESNCKHIRKLKKWERQKFSRDFVNCVKQKQNKTEEYENLRSAKSSSLPDLCEAEEDLSCKDMRLRSSSIDIKSSINL